MNNKSIIAVLVLTIITVITLTITITYSYLSTSTTQTTPNTLNTPCFGVTFTDSNRINITSYPMSSSSAFSKLTPYKFTVKNTCATVTNYCNNRA